MSSYDPSAPSDPPPTASPAGGTSLRPPLRRSQDRRVVAGVCGGLGEYFGVDPVLFRVVLVVLTIFGGWGLVLYLLGWLLIPNAPAADGTARPPRNTTALWLIGAVVVALLVVPVVLGLARALFWQFGGYHGMSMPFMFGDAPTRLFWPGAGSLLLLLGAAAVIWWLVRRDADQSTARTSRAMPSAPMPTTTPAPPTHPVTSPAVESTVYPDAGTTTTMTAPTVAFAPASTWTDPAPATAPTPPPPAPTPRRPRSVLGPLTVSVTAVVVGLLWALRVTDHDVPIAVILASALGVVALGLLIGTWWGRSRGLIVLGVLLSIATAVVAAFPPVNLTGGVGEQNWNVRSASVAAAQSPYRIGIGQGTLDVTPLGLSPNGGQTVPVEASVGVGQLTVYVPSNTDLLVTTNVGLGTVTWQGSRGSTDYSGRNVAHTFNVDRPDASTTLLLDLSVDMGRILIVSTGVTR